MFDIIYGLAVPPGRAALHLLRVSGPGCCAVLSPLWKGKNLQPRRATYVLLANNKGEIIDDVVATYFPGPNSYSGEDSIEITSHGNPIILSKVMNAVELLGCRMAKPGEFTQRAYLNGKLDLTQAEAINQIIHAESENGLILARSAANGLLSEEIQAIRVLLIQALSFLEAHIDFSEDEVGGYSPLEVSPKIQAVAERLQRLHGTYSDGRKLREGVHVALAGKPNAGKSSLFNSLLKSERAIVTDIPGTTRDVLEEKFRIEGRDFVLFDTAGLRESNDTVEQIGVQRSRRTLAGADIVLYLLDGQSDVEEIMAELQEFHSRHPDVTTRTSVCLSKFDLWADAPFANQKIDILREKLFCAVDAFSTENTGWILKCLCDSFDAQSTMNLLSRMPVLISERQKFSVEDALALLQEVQEHLGRNDYPERIASLLNSTLRSLNGIIGEVSVDEVLHVIFSSFCIGK